jgi:hypothetical protein
MFGDTAVASPTSDSRGFSLFNRRPSNGNASLDDEPRERAATEATPRPVDDLDGLFNALPEAAPGAPSEITADGHNVVHEALKAVDVWFKYEVSALEREASQLAQQWAQRGLPRHDLVSQTPSEAEQVLTQRAIEIYAAWISRVQRRIAAATAKQIGRMQRAVTDAQHALQAFRQSQSLLREAREDSRANEESRPVEPVAHEESTVLARRQLHHGFWPLIIALVCAEFVANAPLFTELFPLNLVVERRITEWLVNQQGSIVTLGFVASGVRLLAAPEPAFLALSVVTFFLFLGHQAGEASQSLVALFKEHTQIPPTVRDRRRRQAAFGIAIALLGVAATIFVLYVARTSVHAAAEQKFAAARTRVATAQAELAKVDTETGNRERISTLRDTLWRLSDDEASQAARTDYAASISRLNLPVTGLNVVLALVAVLAGYLRKEVVVTPDEKNETSPPAPVASDDVRPNLIQEMNQRRLDVKRHLDEAEAAHTFAQQLIQSDSTAQWRGIVERLNCAIPRFRSENALMRHLDPRDIKSFQLPAMLNLTAPERVPPNEDVLDLLQTLRDALNVLAVQWRQLDSRGPFDANTEAPRA